MVVINVALQTRALAILNSTAISGFVGVIPDPMWSPPLATRSETMADGVVIESPLILTNNRSHVTKRNSFSPGLVTITFCLRTDLVTLTGQMIVRQPH